MVRDGAAEPHLAGAPLVRLVVVEHELAEQPVAVHEWDEGESDDALGLDGPFEIRVEAGCGHVGDEHRQGVGLVLGPRRVAFRSRAVLVREPPRRAKAHHSGFVAQEHGGAIRLRGLEQRVDGFLEQLIESRRARDRIGYAVHRIHFADALAQRFALTDVARCFEHVGDSAVAVVDGCPRRLDCDPLAGGCAQPARHGLDRARRQALGRSLPQVRGRPSP